MNKLTLSITLACLFFISTLSTSMILIYSQNNHTENKLDNSGIKSNTAGEYDISTLKTSAVGSMFYDSMMIVGINTICILGNSGKVHCDSAFGLGEPSFHSGYFEPFSGVLPLQGKIKSITSDSSNANLGCGLYYDGNISCWSFGGSAPSWFGEKDEYGIYNLNLSKQIINFAFSNYMICYILINGTGECTYDFQNEPKIITKNIKQLVVAYNKICIVTWERDVYCDIIWSGHSSSEYELFSPFSGYTTTHGQGALISSSGSEICIADYSGKTIPRDTTCTSGGYGWGVVLGMTNGGLHVSPNTNHCYIQSNGYLICEIYVGEINYGEGPAATAVQGDGQQICIINTHEEVKCWIVNSDFEYVESTPIYFSQSDFVIDGPSGSIADMDGDGVIDIYDSTFSLEVKQQQIDSGYEHTCAIDINNDIQCWGANNEGQLGIGHLNQVNIPTKIQTSDKYQSVSAGFAHTCAITIHNQLQCWGSNSKGQLGLNTLFDMLNPAVVTINGLPFQAIAVDTGGNHTCALNLTNTMFCWGSNSNGQLGLGSTIDYDTPQIISTNPVQLRPKDIATGDSHTCAIDDDWFLYCWGDNEFGQLPNWQSSGGISNSTSPMFSGWTSTRVIAGEHHTCIWGDEFADVAGSPWLAEMRSGISCSGANELGQLGDGTTTSRSDFLPVKYGSGSVISIVAMAVSGWNHNCILGVQSVGVMCWGSNTSGQIGWSDASPLYGQNLQSSYYTNPINIGVLSNSISISAGGNHSCVVDFEGSIACVGDNSKMQLGRSQTTLANSQYPNILLSDAFHSIFLADDLSPGTMSSSTHSTCYLNLTQEVNCLMSQTDKSIFSRLYESDQPISFTEFGTDSVDVQTVDGLVCTVDANQSVGCIGQIWQQVNNFQNTMTFYDQKHNSSLPMGISKLVLGKQTACGILENGTVVCEGKYHGSTNVNGISSIFSYPAYPENLSQHGNALDIAVWNSPYYDPDGSTFCAIFENSKIACWGEDFWYLSGRGGASQSPFQSIHQNNLPEVTADLPPNFVPKSIQDASDGFCVISTDNEVACWGNALQNYNLQPTPEPTIFPIPLVSTDSLKEFSARNGIACALYYSGDFYCLNSTYSWTFISSNVINHTSKPSGICYNSNQSELHCLVGTGEFRSLQYLGNGLITVQRGETNLFGNVRVIQYINKDKDLDGFTDDDFPNDSTRSVTCPDGQIGRFRCDYVPPGYYFNNNVSNLPIRCHPGTYQPNPGSSVCIDALPGNYSAGYGNNVIEMCDIGYFEPDFGSLQCNMTTPGNITNEVGSKSQQPCVVGTYQPLPGQNICFDSSPGFYVNSTGETGQKACPAGTYLPDTQSDSMDDCMPTPPGTYSEEGASEPINCNPGTYQPSYGGDHCKDANPGFYVTGVGESTQYPCVPGSYTSSSGSMVCSQTNPGYFVNISEATQQLPCEPGTYQNNRNSTECIITAPGNYSTSGSDSQRPCYIGTYAPFSKMGECIDAGYGFYVPQQGSSLRIQCPLGQSTSIEQSRNLEDCIEAEAGNFVDPTGGPETKCFNGSYQPLMGQTSCLDADVGFFVSSEGMISQMPCVSGTYQPERGQTTCLDAEIGYYVESAGATVQLPCPSGFITNSTGSTSILQCDVEGFSQLENNFDDDGTSDIESEKDSMSSDSSIVYVVVPLIGVSAVVGLVIFRKIRSRSEEMNEDETNAVEEYEQMTQTTNRKSEKEIEIQTTTELEESSEEYVVDEHGISWYEDEDGVWWYWDDAENAWFQY